MQILKWIAFSTFACIAVAKPQQQQIYQYDNNYQSSLLSPFWPFMVVQQPKDVTLKFNRFSVESQPPIYLRKSLSSESSSTVLTKDNSELSQKTAGINCKNGFAAHQMDCNKYYQCSGTEVIENSCPPGLMWNNIEVLCDWAANVNCDNNFQEAEEVPPSQQQLQEPVTQETAPTQPPKDFSSGQSQETGKLVVCYFTNWAWYRPGIGKYSPELIDPELCTHINFGFAVLDPFNLVIKTHDSWSDLDNKFYERVVAYKAKGIKVLVAIGGWNDSEGGKYSKMANDPASRSRFITSAIEFIEKFGFDGLDLDWEYPVCWQVDCKQGPKSDKDAFSALVTELSAAFKPKGLLLSAAVSPSKQVIDEGYDVPVLNQYLDYINVMTYDYFGHWDKQTGHVAPLYSYPEIAIAEFNCNFTMNYWHQQGADKKKLIMGMPMYGQTFTLNSPTPSGLNVPAGKGLAGEFTRQAGFTAYYEICHNIKTQGWQVVRDDANVERVGPYATYGLQWVGFDDSKMIREKSQLIMDQGFGGGMIWALDLDDFANRCGCEPYPLLRTINRVLRMYNAPDPGCDIKSNQVAVKAVANNPMYVVSNPHVQYLTPSFQTPLTAFYQVPYLTNFFGKK